jgi:ribulose-bisphosphate carboxylase large chain
MSRKKEVSFCEFSPLKAAGPKPNISAFYKHKKNCRWHGIKDEPYKHEAGGWSDIMRMVLIGSHGESAGFHLRYFEIGMGGSSSFEEHRHEHVVICIRGRGIVRFGNKKRRMDYLDTLYISPDTPHQLSNPYDEPFGFFCIVNAKRDRPRLLK